MFKKIKGLFRIFLITSVSVFISSCEEIKNLMHNDEWPDSNKVSSWVNDDETFGLELFANYVPMGSGATVALPGAHSLYIVHEGIMYRGYHSTFGGVAEPFDYSLDGLEGDGEIRLLKRHSKDEITVQLTGPLNIESIRLHRGEIPIYEASAIAYEGFGGVYKSLVPANGVTADGSSKVMFLFNEDYGKVEGISARFYCGNTQIKDAKITGTLSDLIDYNGKAAVIYTAPEDYCPDYGSSYFNFDIQFSVKFKDKVGKTWRIFSFEDFTIHRPAVLLVAGLFGLGEGTYDDMKKYLVDGYFEDDYVNIISYVSTGVNSFDYNTFKNQIVGNAMSDMHASLLNKGVVSSKYDLVGYSMGGILSRLYAQKINTDPVNRIITINTPHYGSSIADLGKNVIIPVFQSLAVVPDAKVSLFSTIVVGLYNSNAMGAFRDLSSDSEATKALNGPTIDRLIGIPVHSFVSIIDMDEIDEMDAVNKISTRKWYDVKNFNSVVSFFVKGGYGQAFLVALNNGDTSDGIVSRDSQEGGLASKYVTLKHAPYKGFLGCGSETHHLNICSQAYTHKSIYDLLTLPHSSELFCLNGYRPMPSARNGKAETAGSKEYFENFTLSDNPATWIKVAAYAMGNEIHANVNFSDDIEDNIIMFKKGDDVYIIEGADNYILETDDSVKLSDWTVIVIGRTASGELTSAMIE